MITATAADQADFPRASFQPPVGARHLQCGVDRLRAGIREEDPVKPVRHDFLQDIGQLECRRMAELKRRHVIEHVQLPCHGFGDFGPIVSETRTYETRSAVENCPAIDIIEVATVCAGNETRIFLELPVAGVRHPVSVEVRQVMLPFFRDSGFGRVPRGIFSTDLRPFLHCVRCAQLGAMSGPSGTGHHCIVAMMQSAT